MIITIMVLDRQHNHRPGLRFHGPASEDHVTESKPAQKQRGASQAAVAWRRFKKNKSALIGGVIVGFFVLVSVYGIFFAPLPSRSFYCLYNGCANLPPFQNWAHPLGTEPSGIDVYSEILHGALGDLYVGVVATAISVAIGLLVGALAGYRSGASGALLLGVTQIFFVLPVLILILLFARIGQLLVAHGLGAHAHSLIFGYIRVAHHSLRHTRGDPQDKGARVRAGGQVARGEQLPDTVQAHPAQRPLAADRPLEPPRGREHPDRSGDQLPRVRRSFHIDLGLLLQEGFSYVRTSWWVSLFPGIAVVIAVLWVQPAWGRSFRRA